MRELPIYVLLVVMNLEKTNHLCFVTHRICFTINLVDILIAKIESYSVIAII